MKKLANIAAVVLAVLAGLGLSCDNGEDDTGYQPSGLGYVLAALTMVSPSFGFLKIDVGNGHVVRKGIAAVGDDSGCVGIPTDEETGDFFIEAHLPDHNAYLFRLNAAGGVVWRQGPPTVVFWWYSDIAYNKKRDELWCQDNTSRAISIYNAATGAYKRHVYFGTARCELPLKVDPTDGSCWQAGYKDLYKLSPTCEEVFHESFENTNYYIYAAALNTSTRHLWVAAACWQTNNPDMLIEYGRDGRRIRTVNILGPSRSEYPSALGADAVTGAIWVAYGDRVMIYDGAGKYVKTLTRYHNVKTILFPPGTDFAVLTSGEEERDNGSSEDGAVIGVNKETGAELWRATEGYYTPYLYSGYVQR